MNRKKALRFIAKGLFKLSGKISSFGFKLVGDPLTPKQDRVKYGMDEPPEEEDDGEPLGVGAATEHAYDALTPEARAMIAPLPIFKEEPKPEPLEGSLEARAVKR